MTSSRFLATQRAGFGAKTIQPAREHYYRFICNAFSRDDRSRNLSGRRVEQVLTEEKRAGLCLPVASLPGRYGIGEIGAEAIRFLEKMKRMRLGVWQFLPLGPTGYGDSPYQSLSTFAGNEMLIDVEDLVAADLLTKAEIKPLTKLPAGSIDYENLIPLKSALLKTAANRFDASASDDMQSGFSQFLDRHNDRWLHDYALFRELKRKHDDQPWHAWDPLYANRDRAALQKLERKQPARLLEWKVLQYLFHRQWRRLRVQARKNGVRLFGDLPIYVALDSADAWARRDILLVNKSGQPERVAGVPPDYFSEDGQLWGNPLYDWSAQEKDGYRWWLDRLNAAIDLYDIVRIDHFRGFESYWSVDARATTARDGRWEPGPGDAVFKAMKKEFKSLPIVAENLGEITDEVEALRRRHKLPGMTVLQFSICDDDFTVAAIPQDSVCYTGTHDNDTTTGWFKGSPGDARSDADILDTRKRALALTAGKKSAIARDFVRMAMESPARLAIAPIADYLGLGSDARINTPGKAYGNWRWRLAANQPSAGICDSIGEMVKETGRG